MTTRTMWWMLPIVQAPCQANSHQMTAAIMRLFAQSAVTSLYSREAATYVKIADGVNADEQHI